jgi:hypothetical protein
MNTPLRYLLERLRVGSVEPELWGDDVVLGLFNEGYRDACERSACLQALTTIPLVIDTAEYALPSDHARTLGVFYNGFPLPELNVSSAFWPEQTGFYGYDDLIGIAPTPASDGTVYLLYGRYGTPFADLDSTFEDGFPLEFYYLLVHYVRWRRWIEQGGAQHITQSRWERDQYDQGVGRLRRYARTLDRSAEPRFISPLERPRLKARLHPSVDAR